MKKTVVPVVFTFDENYAAGASVAIQSLLANKKPTTEYELYVLYMELRDKTRRKLSQWHPINWIKLNPQSFEGLPVTERYNVAAWYSCIIPEIITGLDRIIYSDVDVLFKCDLAELYAMDLQGKWCAAPPECYNMHDRECSKLMGDIIFIGDIFVLDLVKTREVHTWQRLCDVGKKIGCTPSMQMDVFNIAIKDQIATIPLEYDIPDFVYHAPPGGYFESDMYSAARIQQALANAKRIHYSENGQPCKIWEWPPEEIPQEYLQYLLKSGFYHYGN